MFPETVLRDRGLRIFASPGPAVIGFRLPLPTTRRVLAVTLLVISLPEPCPCPCPWAFWASSSCRLKQKSFFTSRSSEICPCQGCLSSCVRAGWLVVFCPWGWPWEARPLSSVEGDLETLSSLKPRSDRGLEGPRSPLSVAVFGLRGRAFVPE